MSSEPRGFGDLVTALNAGRLSRRDFLSRAAALGVSASVASVLAACGGSATGAGSSGGSAKSELVVATPATPSGIDFEFFFDQDNWDNIGNLNDRLTTWPIVPGPQSGAYNTDWNTSNIAALTKPRMAEGWDVSKDGTTYTFHLRKGWPSHAGNEFTAADVKWSVERSFAVKGIGAFFNTIQNLPSPDAVKVLDKYTVQYTLSSPTPDFLLELSAFWRSITDSTEAKRHATSSDPWAKAWLKNNSAGFGPYKLEALTPGQEFVWVASPGHPYPPKIPRITFRIIPDDSSRTALLSRGEVDAAQFVTPTELLTLQKTSGIKVWNFPGYAMIQVPMNPKFPPLDNPLVRQALSYATPYESIVKDVFRGFARPAHGPLSQADAGYSPGLSPYSYDLGKAKALLAKAGFAKGFSTWYGYNTAEPVGEQVGVALQSSFKQIGVNLQLRPIAPAIYDQVAYGAKAPMTYFNFGADSPDPHYSLAVFYLSTSTNNWGGYHSSRFDACIKQGTNILDWKRRLAWHQQCENILVTDAAWLWIAQPGFQVPTRSNVSGVNWYPGQATMWSLVHFV
jgi:peptide/nickel transport system substrate-binding protein